MSAVYVYRCFDAKGRLLYVGQSSNPWARFRQHLFENTWWAERVTSGRIRVYPTRDAARHAERQAIITEHPIHNRQHFGDGTRRSWSQQTYIEQARARLEYPFGPGPGGDAALREMRIEYRERYGRSLGVDAGSVPIGYNRGQIRSGRRRSIA